MEYEPETGEGASPESESAQGRMGRAKEFVGRKYTQARTRVEEADFPGMMEQLRTYVRSNPGKALLISIGAGFVIGLLLRRRDDD